MLGKVSSVRNDRSPDNVEVHFSEAEDDEDCDAEEDDCNVDERSGLQINEFGSKDDTLAENDRSLIRKIVLQLADRKKKHRNYKEAIDAFISS